MLVDDDGGQMEQQAAVEEWSGWDSAFCSPYCCAYASNDSVALPDSGLVPLPCRMCRAGACSDSTLDVSVPQASGLG